jgi:hypothetical protein
MAGSMPLGRFYGSPPCGGLLVAGVQDPPVEADHEEPRALGLQSAT